MQIPDDVEGLDSVQEKVISAALALQDLEASDIMTVFDKVYVLPMDSVIDENLI